jgi:putative FmdB family regulatory protein
MPIYEYRCADCNHQFELMQKFSDPPLEQCPSCAGQVHKLISRSAFHLKGSGWYVTDYARKGGQTGTSSNSSESSSTTDTSASTSSSATDGKAASPTKTDTAAA